jgi:predicted nucleic acid-binding protein
LNGYLLDTNIVSMLAPASAADSLAFLQWLERNGAEGGVFLSVVTIHEIEKGVLLLEHRGATAKATALRAWLTGLLAAYDDQILGVDCAVALLAGQLEAKAIAAGHHPGMADATIAGIAQAHGLVVITRNIKHFEPFGIAVSAPESLT